ncbi:Prolyl 4-hydroxylase subunit alpha-1, partial [Pseudolycoriella hygida]
SNIEIENRNKVEPKVNKCRRNRLSHGELVHFIKLRIPYHRLFQPTPKVSGNVQRIGQNVIRLTMFPSPGSYEPKKAKVLTEMELRRFIDEAPDVAWLDVKVVCIFAIFGACRSHEFPQILTSHITRYDDLYHIEIKDTKNTKPNRFAITEPLLGYVRRYEALRPAQATTDRFFINYRNEKCTVQVIGKHKFYQMPHRIAEFLNLPDLDLYTGHSFRRSSTSLYANTGAIIEAVKRHTGHSSSKFRIIMCNAVLYILLLLCVGLANCEIFSAIEELEQQFSNENLLITALEKFSEKVKDDYVYRKLKKWRIEHSTAEDDITGYITNPLNAFLIIKRSIEDVKLMKSRFPQEAKKFLRDISALQASDVDLLGAVEGMLRLQFFYKLKTKDFANGIIDGDETRSPLSVHDLFVIGQKARAIEGQDYIYFALEYLQLAYEKLQEGLDVDNEVNEKFLIRSLVSTYKTVKNFEKALEMLEELKTKFPGDKTYSQISDSLYDARKNGAKNANVNDPFSDYFEHTGTFSVLKDRILNSQVCRGNISRSTHEISKLHCHYISTNAFSTLARFKVEEVNLEPYIVLFVDVLSDDELQVLKDSSKEKLSRAMATQDEIVTSRRVAQLSWHYQSEDEIFRKLTQRVEDMTALSLETAEPLQTQNYGIGGHYDGHWDCVMKFDTPFHTYGGNRIATVLFYLSDVVKGGGTVFTYLKLHVSPRKGAAIFWHNMTPSGSCDFKTRHSACPVLLGSKWVANKWIREYGNEQKRPCEPGKVSNNADSTIHSITFRITVRAVGDSETSSDVMPSASSEIKAIASTKEEMAFPTSPNT